MSNYYKLVKFEEGFSSTPYLCSQGYPTVGYGMRIGPRGVLIKNYSFTLPEPAAEKWLECHTEEMIDEMYKHPAIKLAFDEALKDDKCEPENWDVSPRFCVIVSMAHQMGVAGLLQFTQTLKFMGFGAWSNAAANMLKSAWAGQTPNRAKRHAEQMRTGQWANEYR